MPYFCAYMIAMLVGECINFPIQRSFVFRSKGKIWYQAFWYLIAFCIVTCIVNSINCIWVGKLIHSPTSIAIMYAQKYGSPPCAASYPIIFHLNVSPNNVMSIPGKPKSTFGSPANASGKNSNITYLSTVIRLLTITNNPPSLIHFEALGCFSENGSICCLTYSFYALHSSKILDSLVLPWTSYLYPNMDYMPIYCTYITCTFSA